MRPTFLLRLEHDVLRQLQPILHQRRSEVPPSKLSRPKKLVKFRRSKKSGIVTKPENGRASHMLASLQLKERQRTVRELKDAMLNHWGPLRLSLVDVSLYEYALSTDIAPIEMAMVDSELKVTSTYSPPPHELISDLHEPSTVALALRQFGYDGRFYDPEGVRRMAKTDFSTSGLATTRWPVFDYKPEEGEDPHVARLIVTSKGHYRFRIPVILTLPSPYVLPRFSLLRRIFRESYAQQLLSAVWKWTRLRKLHQFTPTAIGIMTGYFLQRTQEPISDMSTKESFASFLRYWSRINELHKDIIISICDPEQPLPSPLTRWTSNFSDPGREPTTNTQTSLQHPQPMYWGSQPLIVRDPYAITQNHAEGVSMSQLNCFASGCQDTLENLDALVSIFEPTLWERIERSLNETLSQVPQGSVLSAQTLADTENKLEGDDSDISSVEKGNSSVSLASWISMSLSKVKGNEDESLTPGGRQSNEKPARRTLSRLLDTFRNASREDVSSVSRTRFIDAFESPSPEDYEAAFVDRIVCKHLLPSVVHRSGRVWRPWHVPGYEEYEAACVDEAFAAELSSPSSHLLVPFVPTSPVSAQKHNTEANSTLEPVNTSTLDTIIFSCADSDVELEDTAFLTEVLQNSAAAEVHQRRVLNKVRGVLKEKYGPRYGVEPFGSSRYGITTLTSDLDLVILDPSMIHGQKPGATPLSKKLYDTRRLSCWLNNGGFKVLKTIPNATVPIIKFLHRRTGVQCDICVNERLGLLNSELLATYCRMSPLLRPMLLLIKLWAKPRGLNTPASEAKGKPTFSSYALALMTVNFLQMRGLLPNLQADLSPLNPMIPGSVYYTQTKTAVVACDVRYHSEIEGWEPTGKPSLREILSDWFAFWGEEFKYADSIVSIRHGRLIDATSCDITKRRGETIRVLDPFIVDKNVAHSITELMIQFFMMECRDAAISLREGMTFRKLTEVSRAAKLRKHLTRQGRMSRFEKLEKMLAAVS